MTARRTPADPEATGGLRSGLGGGLGITVLAVTAAAFRGGWGEAVVTGVICGVCVAGALGLVVLARRARR